MQAADEDSLVQFIYPGIGSDPPPSPDFFLDRMILAPRNVDVSAINHRILDEMAGDETVLYSADTIITEPGADSDMRDDIPAEFLRAVTASGMPPGELHLKVGCPIILLRNLNPAQGLCNGTRMVVTRVANRVLETRLIGGEHNGNIVLIPRISVLPSETINSVTFKFKRRQFPVQLAFALTINKAQGQSVRYVGLDLRNPVFSHGQLYVGLSRVTAAHNLRILVADLEDVAAADLNAGSAVASTTNVVYREVLL